MSYYAVENPNYSPIALGEFEDGSQEWLEAREHGIGKSLADPDYIPVTIGGSSAAIVLGISPWKSKLELYGEKSGLLEAKYPKAKNQVILDTGHQLEEFVALTFKRKMLEEGVKLEMWNDTNMYQHPHYKFALANLDRRIKVNGVPGILECKTCSNWDTIKKYWQNGVCPPYYEAQCRFYMAVMNLPYTYICCAWGMGPSDNAVVRIDRDLEVEETIFKELEQFVDDCIEGNEPTLESENLEELAKFYTRLYGEIENDAPAVELPDSEEVLELLESAEAIFARKEKVMKMLADIEKEEAKITCQVMKITGGKSTYATYRLDDETVMGIKLALPMKREGFDEEALKADDPAMYDKYVKHEDKFDITKYKKENKTDAKRYIIPAKVNPDKAVTLKEVKKVSLPLPKEA